MKNFTSRAYYNNIKIYLIYLIKWLIQHQHMPFIDLEDLNLKKKKTCEKFIRETTTRRKI